MKTQATITHSLEDIHITSEELQRQIMQLLHWNEEQYALFIYETGLAYLQEYFGHDKEAIDILARRREFWNWFKNHWSYRNQVFLETFLLDTCEMSWKLELYHALHNAKQLACEIYPSSTVLGTSFHIIKMQLAC
jgi:hypothetical protein